MTGLSVRVSLAGSSAVVGVGQQYFLQYMHHYCPQCVCLLLFMVHSQYMYNVPLCAVFVVVQWGGIVGSECVAISPLPERVVAGCRSGSCSQAAVREQQPSC